jgi:hypothetical protein
LTTSQNIKKISLSSNISFGGKLILRFFSLLLSTNKQNTLKTMVLVLWSQRTTQAFLSKASRAATHSRPTAATAANVLVPTISIRTLSATAAPEETTTTAPNHSGKPSDDTPPPSLPDMDEIVSLCKRRGIIFPSSEIYNGFAGFFDYGPLGVELKKNLKDAWWKHFVTQREDVVGLDSSIIHNPTTWKSSGMYPTKLFEYHQ